MLTHQFDPSRLIPPQKGSLAYEIALLKAGRHPNPDKFKAKLKAYHTMVQKAPPGSWFHHLLHPEVPVKTSWGWRAYIPGAWPQRKTKL
jgi:hypothetical protein